eukprot:1594563-Amphidinium_carterae.1
MASSATGRPWNMVTWASSLSGCTAPTSMFSSWKRTFFSSEGGAAGAAPWSASRFLLLFPSPFLQFSSAQGPP